jgi:hypothetical protein
MFFKIFENKIISWCVFIYPSIVQRAGPVAQTAFPYQSNFSGLTDSGNLICKLCKIDLFDNGNNVFLS